MTKEILVVDIETTGFLNQGGKIIEIGIVKLNLETGNIIPVYNSLIKEDGFDILHTQDSLGWIFRNSDLTYEQVNYAPSLNNQKEIIQGLFDEYYATAYNKDFDFGFLKNRGFRIRELPCPMVVATPILNLPTAKGFGSPKYPTVEEAWHYFFGESAYIEAHRGLDDAKHEAKIVYQLFKLGKFKIPGINIQSISIESSNCGIDDSSNKHVPEIIESNNKHKLIRKQNTQNRKWGFCDQNNNLIIDYIYDWIGITNEGMVEVHINRKIGFVDVWGENVIPCQFDEAQFFSEGLNAVSKNGLFGFIDRAGIVRIPFVYNEVLRFSEGLAPARSGEKEPYQFGYINTDGHAITEFKYYEADIFMYGLGKVSVWNKNTNKVRIGFINRFGEEVIPLKYKKAETLDNGYVTAKFNGKWGLIDSQGNELTLFKYDLPIDDFHDGISLVCVNRKIGLINIYGDEIVPPIYDIAECYMDSGAILKLNDESFFVDNFGNIKKLKPI
ncbi:DNA polymerase III, epsilon subunit [Bacteroidales bacterium 6E]|nr:DNA polymerase III, epsilon subunit [Bacteroidales bacterium 6E]